MIYLDNAATTLHKPPAVVQAVVSALNGMGNSARGAYPSALSAARTVYGAREKLAALFHCSPDHVVFTSNSTEALNVVLNGFWTAGDHVLTTDYEHNSVLRPLYRLEAEGKISLRFVAADRQGALNYSDFETLLRPNTRAIVCTHASNLTGDLLDIERIGKIAHGHGLLFIVDASQTAGVFPIDMQKYHIDALCFTGHKSLLGPQGTGGLCIAEGLRLRPWKVGGTGVQSYSPEQPSQYPTLLEAGTLNGHGIAGLSAALDFIAETGMERIRAYEQGLAERFYRGVRDLPGVAVYGDFSQKERAPIVALNIGDTDSAETSDALSGLYSIATRPGAHCAPRLHRALGTEKQGAVRFSFSWYNTKAEVDFALQAIKELL